LIGKKARERGIHTTQPLGPMPLLDDLQGLGHRLHG